LIRERLQQDRVDHAEDGRVGADAKCHDRYAHERKAWTSSSRANGIRHIVPNVIDPHERSSITVSILGVLNAAERSFRCALRVVWRQASALIVVLEQPQV
jgi:hypothetical protein